MEIHEQESASWWDDDSLPFLQWQIESLGGGFDSSEVCLEDIDNNRGQGFELGEWCHQVLVMQGTT